MLSLGIDMRREGARVGQGRNRGTGTYLWVAYLVVAVAVMIALRALVDELDFLGVGWIILLVVLPLLPWLLPRLGEFLRAVSPYVQTFRLGVVQLDLRTVRSEPITIPASGHLASLPNDLSALSSGTAVEMIVSALQDLRRRGGSPVGIIDLQDGRKWRLPNLYFLARLLETEPVVSQLLFTEMSGGDDGFLIGTCQPGELRRHIEHTEPRYATAAATLQLAPGVALDPQARSDTLAASFQEFTTGLGAPVDDEERSPMGYVTTTRVSDMAGLLSRAAVEAPGETLDDNALRIIIEAPHRYVPTTAGRRLTGVIDRDKVALAVARGAIHSVG